MITELQQRLGQVLRYYPSENQTVAKELGRFLDIDPRHLVVANGSTELITWINERYISESLITGVPTFGRWNDTARELGRVVHPCFRLECNDFQIDIETILRLSRETHARAIAICNPNNPTGAVFCRGEVLTLLEESRHLDVVVIDESFIDFVYEEDIPSVAHDIVGFENAVVIKSLGKNLGLHGLRYGYAVAGERITNQLRHMLPPWNVNAVAEELIRMMVDCQQDYEQSRRRVVRDA